MIQDARNERKERLRLLRKMRNLEIAFSDVIRKPPGCVAGIPVIRVLELAYFTRPAPKRLVQLNEDAARVGLNAYLPIAALPLRGRDFFSEWVDENIMPMLQSRQRQIQTTQEGKMAQVLDSMPTRTHKGRAAKYPYDEWFDGRIYSLTEGEDFEGKRDSFTQLLRSAAETRGKYLQIVNTESGVAIQAQPLTDEIKARRAEIAAKRAATKAQNEAEAKNGNKKGAKAAA